VKYAQKKTFYFTGLVCLFLMFVYSLLRILGSLLDLKYDAVTEKTWVAEITNYNLSLATIIWLLLSIVILAVFITLLLAKNKMLKS